MENAFPTIMGRARAMMNFAGFTTSKRRQLWCEAANIATMLDNILVHEQNNRNLSNFKILCVLLSHELLSTKIYHTSIYIFYILFTSRQVQEFKNYQNPSSTSKVTSKTNLIILLNLFSICNTFEFRANQVFR